ncbi:hypothetical protein [Aurantiacibacter marinus]|uniref:Acid phosphatase n=2 Tax=Aurantiacibacter marinus TaxID=874156 RepID=A0A0H0XQP8_9SPHN|nr:hypothetical protein [Aurantiacibacter marinus]KLI64913.1 hypothetical protein AAV99_05275 [Aurantiacibacter marinus]
MRAPFIRAIVLIAAAVSLQGCVLAAAAVPLLATGAVVRNAVTGERTRQAIAEGNAIDPDSIAVASLGQYALVEGSLLPAPVAAAPIDGPFGELRMHALAALAAGMDGQFSALLANPASLQPTRSQCEAGVPAILIDLDPIGGLVQLSGTNAQNSPLVPLLDALRREGVAVAWITDREPQDAGAIRQRLLETRLDPTARDPLFVQRYPGELKQSRRQALLETHCPIAIAGDDVRDFDDLYLYLIDPSSAGGLEPMIGDGWFLIPNPLD